MNRRDVLDLGLSAGLLSIGVAAAAESPAAGTQDMHEMSKMHSHLAADSQYADLIAATSRCITTGDSCLSHCLTLLGQGDKDLAACAKTVRDTIAACTALQQLAASGSSHVKALATVVSAICADCETECRKHERHPVCKECEKACHDCKTLCDKVAA
jgi:Cys-rich four helix bundle protein (predicted Tat secretion target)